MCMFLFLLVNDILLLMLIINLDVFYFIGDDYIFGVLRVAFLERSNL